MTVEIMTCNSSYQNGECDGGYHEIHTIKYLQSVDHIIATIDSIIKNNLLYGCKDTILEEIVVSCDNERIVEEINNYYKQRVIEIKVQAGFELIP